MVSPRPALLAPVLVLAACDHDDHHVPVVLIGDMDARPGVGAVEAGAGAGAGDGGCASAPDDVDYDRDGFSRQQGDCDECDPARGPGALELPMNGVDDDCRDGDAVGPDAGLSSCDQELEPDDTSLEAVAAALGLCRQVRTAASHDWGLIKGRSGWRTLAGAEQLHDPRQAWLPQAFGDVRPREGGRFVVLSTGVARDPSAPREYTEACDVFTGGADSGAGWSGGVSPPLGYPRDSSECGRRPVSEGALAFDDVGLELALRVPTNATGIAFDSIFFTYEYPDYVCREFNDFFVVLMDPRPRGSHEDNILFDDNGDPIGVNSGLLQVCSKSSRAARSIACALGADQLDGTGYARGEATCGASGNEARDIGGASTGWLHTEVPVEAGELVSLRFVLWDSGDPLLDSTVVIDNFRFLVSPPQTGTRPITSR